MALDRAASALDPAGPVAASLAVWAWVLIIAAGAVLLLVTGLALWSLRRAAPDASARRWLFGGGLVLPLALLLPLAVWSLRHDAGAAAAPDRDTLFVRVTAHMWWWEVRYPGATPAARDDVVLANELRIPVGRTVQLSLNTADVIHAFWVPALAGKVDVLPGRLAQLRFSADRPGVFHAPCAEFCGSEHSHMALTVVALEPDDYARWIARQAEPAMPPATALAQRGRAVFVQQRCDACHAVRGLGGEPAGRAPDLSHVASRLTLGAGRLANNEGAYALWLRELRQLKPGARMPGYGHLDADTLAALDGYLSGLR
jgi:cytochrome c oxidase subunit II